MIEVSQQTGMIIISFFAGGAMASLAIGVMEVLYRSRRARVFRGSNRRRP